jgi:hypothetical protein
MLASLAVAANNRVDVSGTYHSNSEDVLLMQKGDRVVGIYECCGGGVIEGRLIGDHVRYRWSSTNGNGMGIWTVDHGRLTGTWGWNVDDTEGGRWDLERVPANELAK